MAPRRSQSPFERLRETLGGNALRCRACGHVDDGGSWDIVATGREVRYRHTCPECGAVDTKEVHVRPHER